MTAGPYRPYTQEKLDFIEKYSLLPRKKLTVLFNQKFDDQRSYSAIKTLCRKNGWLTDPSDWHFKKGSVPVNKGKKGLQGGNRTSFKKGIIPHNTKPIGHEYVNHEGNGYATYPHEVKQEIIGFTRLKLKIYDLNKEQASCK